MDALTYSAKRADLIRDSHRITYTGGEALRVPFEAPAYLFRRFNQDLEVAVEAAIQGGEHGVLVVWTGARYEISILVPSRVPDQDVPPSLGAQHRATPSEHHH